MIRYELFKLGEPNFTPDMDDIGRMVADLRTWEVVPHPDFGLPFTSLLPLRQGDERSGLPYKWADALGNGELALGYMPATPRSVAGWIDVLHSFINNTNILLYRVMGNQHSDQNLAEIKFAFSEVDGGFVAEFVYGLLDKSQKGAGIVTNSFLALRDILPELVSANGAKLICLKTAVSDRNIPSLRIVEKVGMVRSLIQDSGESPIVMGGNSISFEYYY